jgi:hypothetical protein
MKPDSPVNRKQDCERKKQEEHELGHGEGEKEARSGADCHDVGRLKNKKETVNPNDQRGQLPKRLDEGADESVQEL